MENPPPAPPVQNFHHEPKVGNNDLLLEVHNMGNVFDQGSFENKKPEIGLNEVEQQGLVSLQILVYYIVITSQMRLLALIEPAEVIGLANVVTR